jgi:hypothetical protein
VKEEAVPTPRRFGSCEALADGRFRSCQLGALYAPFDPEAGCDGSTGFAFRKCFRPSSRPATAIGRASIRFTRFAALIVFEQQPGVAIPKSFAAAAALVKSREAGATISAPRTRSSVAARPYAAGR